MPQIVILVGVAAVRQALAALSIAAASLGTAFSLHAGSVPSRLANARKTMEEIARCLKNLSDKDREKIMRLSKGFFEDLDDLLGRLQQAVYALETRSVTAAFTEQYLWSRLMTETKQAEKDLKRLYFDLAKTTNSVRESPGSLLGTTARAMSEWQRRVSELPFSPEHNDSRRSSKGLTPPTSETARSDRIRTVLARTRRTMSLDDDDSESFQIGSEVQVD